MLELCLAISGVLPSVMTGVTYLLTYAMEKSPSEASWFSASQQIPRILCNPKVHYRTHKCPPPVPILSNNWWRCL